MTELGPLGPLDELLAHQIVDTFATVSQSDRSWTEKICAMAADPTTPDVIYVGTAPAAVFKSEDAGVSFRELSALRELPDYSKWTLPPPPPRVI